MSPRLFDGDEELGKRDDDHRPGGKKNPLGLAWQHRRIPVVHGPHRRTLKKMAWGILAFVALYYFFKNMPTDLEQPRARPNFARPSEELYMRQPARSSPPAYASKPSKEETPPAPIHDFNGPIKFYELASSLHAVARAKGSELINANVVRLVLQMLTVIC